MTESDTNPTPPPLPWAIQASSLLALILLWPVAFLARTLLALYMPRARIWFALAIAVFSIVLYGIRLGSSLNTLSTGSLACIRQLATIALFDSLQNLTLMIGSGCVPAPISCLIPLTHVHWKCRSGSYWPAALTVVGFLVLIAVSFEYIRIAALALISTSPLFMAYSTQLRIAALDSNSIPNSLTLQLASSLFQIPIWVVLYPATSRIQAAIVPLPTRFHPISSALFTEHDSISIGTVVAVLALLIANFIVVWRVGIRTGGGDIDGVQPWLQYASRGADLLLPPFASPQQVEMATLIGAGVAFVISGIMSPVRSFFVPLCSGASLILAASAIQMQASIRLQPCSPARHQYDLASMT